MNIRGGRRRSSLKKMGCCEGHPNPLESSSLSWPLEQQLSREEERVYLLFLKHLVRGERRAMSIIRWKKCCLCQFDACVTAFCSKSGQFFTQDEIDAQTASFELRHKAFCTLKWSRVAFEPSIIESIVHLVRLATVSEKILQNTRYSKTSLKTRASQTLLVQIPCRS